MHENCPSILKARGIIPIYKGGMKGFPETLDANISHNESAWQGSKKTGVRSDNTELIYPLFLSFFFLSPLFSLSKRIKKE